MFAPEPPPAGMVGFFLKWAPRQGNTLCVLAPWQSGPTPNPIRSSRTWRFSIDSSIDSTVDSTIALPDAACAPPPPPSEVPALRAPAAEPVATFVRPSAALFVPMVQAFSLPDFRIAAELALSPALQQAPALRAPAAEPAATFLRPSVALFVPVVQAFSLPDFRIAAELPLSAVLYQAPALPASAAEPVAIFVQQSFAQPPAAVGGSRQTDWPAFSEFADLHHARGLACAPAIPGPAAEPAASFVQPFLAQPVSAAAPAIRLTAFLIAIEPEPLPMIDELIASTSFCEVFSTAPAAEAACSFVRTSSASAFPTAIALVFPLCAPGAIAGPHVPVAAKWLAPPKAEPAMAAVWPCAADSPIELILHAASSYTLDIPGFVHCQSPDLAAAAGGPAADAAESWLPCSTAAVPMPVARRNQTMHAVEALALTKPAATLAVSLPATDTLGAEAVESLLTSASAAALSRATAVHLPACQLAASNTQIVPRFDSLLLTLDAAKPKLASAKVIAMKPISTLTVAKPQHDAQRPLSSLPQSGLLALEYHSYRLRSAPVARVEWRTRRIALFPPRLLLRPIFERHEQIVKLKPVSKEAAFAEVFTLPEARRPASVFPRHAGWAIAASLFAGAVLWLGAGASRNGRQMTIARTYSGEASTQAASSASRNAGAAAGKTESMGAIAWMRGAISNRATVEATDNFRGGMESWGSQPKTYAAGWSRHAEGYVHPGKLALFSPSLQFTDYRLEFFGQIEAKSVGWVVRAQDPKNYYAMKFTVVESGLRTIIALAHYPVVDGKTGHKVETPLNVMVHRDRPFQVAVNVKGNRFVTFVNGAEVDSWRDDTLASGGIGFFSEAGERARIYWMKVSKNDDWVGRVCAIFSGSSDTQSTAELWGPGYPGGATPPSAPGGPDQVTLAAAGMALPYFRASQKKARVSTYWKRDESWNS